MGFEWGWKEDAPQSKAFKEAVVLSPPRPVDEPVSEHPPEVPIRLGFNTTVKIQQLLPIFRRTKNVDRYFRDKTQISENGGWKK